MTILLRNACNAEGDLRMSPFFARGLMLAGVFVAAMAADATTDAEAGRWPVTKWCVRTYDGQIDCSYFTFEQCQAAVSATGGDCAINPRFAGYPTGPYQPRRYYR
jgi:hypothetical protein